MSRQVAFYTRGELGPTMGVPAIRAFYLATEVSKQFEVTLVAGRAGDLDTRLPVVVVDPDDDRAITRALAPYDVVIATNLPLKTMRSLARSSKNVIYDLYVPYVTEYLGLTEEFQEKPVERRFSRWTTLNQRYPLVTGNAFICPSERQRDFWLGMLAELDRVDADAHAHDPTMRSLVDVVPFGLPSEPPTKTRSVLKGVVEGIDPADKVLLWSGGIWNWFDPLTVIRAVARLADRRNDVKLFFMGMTPPEARPSVMSDRAAALSDGLGLTDRFVFFNRGWVPYAARADYLLEADLGVSAHLETLESRFAYRTRLLDHIWALLPSVVTGGDDLGDLIASERLGSVVPPGDVAAFADAIEMLLDDRQAYSVAKQGLRRVRDTMTWERAAQSLVPLISEPGVPVRSGVTGAAISLDDVRLRAEISLALGGPRAVIARRARKLVRRH